MFANRFIRGVKVPCVALYIVAVILIVAYGYLLRKTGTADVLEKKVVDHPSCPGFDGWAVTHFLFFGVLGFLYPGHYLQMLLVSLAWEGVEHFLGTNQIKVSGKRLQLVGDQDEDGRPTGNDETWWYGRFVTDPMFNLAGYILGSEAANAFWPNTYEDARRGPERRAPARALEQPLGWAPGQAAPSRGFPQPAFRAYGP